MSTSTLSDSILSERQWQLAHAIAQQLVLDDADANELEKARAYLRAIAHEKDPGTRFLKYLETLATQGHRIGHSKKTKGYYVSMEQVCKQYLQADLANTEALQAIVGWAFRLMRYYKDGVPPEDLREIAAQTEVMEVQSERQAEIAELVAEEDFSVGQELEVSVTAIKGNKVTYEILGTIRLTQKEPKKAKSLSEGQTVKVAIDELKDDGKIKKVKLIDRS
ncbi:MAG: hypothetical protein D6680_15110 [Cyanobacteria bacterium J007]|nr:MAG: hypothetical protein D6680_15110 [Cyanobacteria bacterium J007]